jgi:membrane protein YqaA with SNARE-associated domain
VKLIFFGSYLSLCTTFLPLPTGWIVAAVATREAAVGSNAWTTTLLVATVGAIGSTIANLNDYHLFTWMLRSHRVAKIRHTKLYEKSAMWFSRSPFFLLVVFNIVPIPVDVVRILATTYRYPRGPFAAANFIGRFLRYAVIAFVTYWWNLGYVAVLALLALAVVLAAVKAIPYLYRKISGRSEVHA